MKVRINVKLDKTIDQRTPTVCRSLLHQIKSCTPSDCRAIHVLSSLFSLKSCIAELQGRENGVFMEQYSVAQFLSKIKIKGIEMHLQKENLKCTHLSSTSFKATFQHHKLSSRHTALQEYRKY